MNTITILLGGNIGNTQQYIEDAEQLLIAQLGLLLKSSSLFESEPWGFESEQWFLNKIIQVTSYKLQVTNDENEALKILDICQAIEMQLGRTRSNNTGYESRPIDIDILFIDDIIISEPRLIIPHPKLHLRRFTLLPLQEIIPNYIHPVLQKTIQTLVEECDDSGKCEIMMKSK
jgi:2-amino-4-hydroxy-6-hydroxymethyldihydropteridine diphosphokinase